MGVRQQFNIKFYNLKLLSLPFPCFHAKTVACSAHQEGLFRTCFHIACLAVSHVVALAQGRLPYLILPRTKYLGISRYGVAHFVRVIPMRPNGERPSSPKLSNMCPPASTASRIRTVTAALSFRMQAEALWG